MIDDKDFCKEDVDFLMDFESEAKNVRLEWEDGFCEDFKEGSFFLNNSFLLDEEKKESEVCMDELESESEVCMDEPGQESEICVEKHETCGQKPEPFVEKSEDSAVLQKKLEVIHKDLFRLDRKFEEELSSSARKDKAVEALQVEVREYRSGLIVKLMKDLLYDMIDMKESISRQAEREHQRGKEEISLEEFEFLGEDIGIFLEKYDVEMYKTEVGGKFAAGKHRIIKRIPTSNPELIHTICESRSYGYIYNGKVLYPEKVSVYVTE